MVEPRRQASTRMQEGMDAQHQFIAFVAVVSTVWIVCPRLFNAATAATESSATRSVYSIDRDASLVSGEAAEDGGQARQHWRSSLSAWPTGTTMQACNFGKECSRQVVRG